MSSVGQSMKAVALDDYGPPETWSLRELAVPQPGPGQILVRIEAASVNPLDIQFAGGITKAAAPLSFPHVPGIDFAGTVAELGPGTTRFAVGEKVFGLAFPRATAKMVGGVVTPSALGTGTFAEYVAVDAASPGVAVRPEGLSAERAATLGLAGLTAMTTLRETGVGRGERVLVVGATGAVGSMVAGLLASGGIEVIATTTSADESYVRGLGVKAVVDYSTGDIVEQTLALVPEGVDVIIATALGAQVGDLVPALRTNGRLISPAFGASKGVPAITRKDITAKVVYTAGRDDDLDSLASRSLSGALPSIVGRTYPLEQAGQAAAAFVAEHTTGKLVLLKD